MEPSIVYGGLVAALSTVFGIMVTVLKIRGDDWKELFYKEREDKKTGERDQADQSRKTAETLLRMSGSLDALIDKVDQFPKRRDDYELPRRGHTS